MSDARALSVCVCVCVCYQLRAGGSFEGKRFSLSLFSVGAMQTPFFFLFPFPTQLPSPLSPLSLGNQLLLQSPLLCFLLTTFTQRHGYSNADMRSSVKRLWMEGETKGGRRKGERGGG